jgi:hypothetical protein
MFRTRAGAEPRVGEGVGNARGHEDEGAGAEDALLARQVEGEFPFQHGEDVGHPGMAVPDRTREPGRHGALGDGDGLVRGLGQEAQPERPSGVGLAFGLG